VTSCLIFFFRCLPCGLNTDGFNSSCLYYFRSLLLAFLSSLLVVFVGLNKAALLSCLTLVLWYVLISCLRSCICKYDKGHASVHILPSYVNYKSFFCSCLRPSVYLRIRRSTFCYRFSTNDILRSWRHCPALESVVVNLPVLWHSKYFLASYDSPVRYFTVLDHKCVATVWMNVLPPSSVGLT
jgi:hypothetical protein